jgi:CheY-like chemotaxis protein
MLNKNADSLDIIISDLRLAGTLDGVQAIEKLQATLKNHVPGIILTGDTSPDRLKYIEEAGLSVIHKPVKSDSLAEILNETFRKDLH